MADTSLKDFCDKARLCEGDRRWLWAHLWVARKSGAHMAIRTLRDFLLIRGMVIEPISVSEMMELLRHLENTVDGVETTFPESLSTLSAGAVPAAGGQIPTPDNLPPAPTIAEACADEDDDE